MLLQIGHHRKLAPVQRCIADAVDALIGLDLERDEITPRTSDDNAGGGDFHGRGNSCNANILTWQALA